ncbi:E3 ubiquitin-protein ligase TRIM71 [Stylophora pistillata]|uniref:E3 ubiquitin-protein ligase TRIM71 n=1 Tax=Stylophora pistillata TaxID=50429 RepID=A0A2B4R900_STYPI|nr:E3 ubiquitin-protein ligase TRIM71 [Stylophora pistillata]
MYWPLKNAKPAKLDVEIVKRKAPGVVTVFIVACFGVMSASLDITSFKAKKITVSWRSKNFKKRTEDVIKRPLYCSKQRHEKEELKYFCKNCETAACQSCVLIDHAGHAITHLEEEAEKQKLEMKSLIKTQRRDLQEEINTMGRLNEDCAKLIQQSNDIKREVQTFVDNLIATIEAKKQNIFTATVNTINAEEIGTLQMESRTKASQSIADGKGLKESIAFHEAQFTLTTSNFEGKECYNKRDNVTVEIRDEQGRDCATDLRITDNKDGLYQISYSARNEGRCEVTVKVNGEHVRGSQFFVLVKPFQFRPVLSFGEAGSTLGKFDWPWGVTVNARNEIAVTDKNNDRVQIFSSEGKYLRSFGKVGDKAGEFNKPRGITFHSNGKIFVADSFNHRIQIFEEAKNEPVGSFGSKGNHDSQLKSPMGSSVDSDGNIIVADAGNKLIKIFSPDGKFLRKIGGKGSFTLPFHCIQYDRYRTVSDSRDQCIKVFDRNGKF